MSFIGAAIGTAADVTKGLLGAEAAQVQAKGQQLGILGSMYQTIATAFGQEIQAQQYDYQAAVAEYQAKVQDINTSVAQQNAAYERDLGEIEASQIGMQTRSQVADMKAKQGASGVSVNEGSPVSVRESMIEIGQYEQSVIRANEQRKAYAFDVEATQSKAQADLYRYTSAMDLVQAANTRTAVGMTMSALPLQTQAYNLAGTAGNIGAMSSIAGAAGSIATRWTQAFQI